MRRLHTRLASDCCARAIGTAPPSLSQAQHKPKHTDVHGRCPGTNRPARSLAVVKPSTPACKNAELDRSPICGLVFNGEENRLMTMRQPPTLGRDDSRRACTATRTTLGLYGGPALIPGTPWGPEEEPRGTRRNNGAGVGPGRRRGGRRRGRGAGPPLPHAATDPRHPSPADPLRVSPRSPDLTARARPHPRCGGCHRRTPARTRAGASPPACQGPSPRTRGPPPGHSRRPGPR